MLLVGAKDDQHQSDNCLPAIITKKAIGDRGDRSLLCLSFLTDEVWRLQDVGWNTRPIRLCIDLDYTDAFSDEYRGRCGVVTPSARRSTAFNQRAIRKAVLPAHARGKSPEQSQAVPSAAETCRPC